MTFVPITFLFSFERIDFLHTHTQTHRESHQKKRSEENKNSRKRHKIQIQSCLLNEFSNDMIRFFVYLAHLFKTSNCKQ